MVTAVVSGGAENFQRAVKGAVNSLKAPGRGLACRSRLSYYRTVQVGPDRQDGVAPALRLLGIRRSARAGMQTSKTISRSTRTKAPIFEIADYEGGGRPVQGRSAADRRPSRPARARFPARADRRRGVGTLAPH